MKRSESAGGIVTNIQGQVLLIMQKGGSWSFPKGHVEEGESHLEAAKREVYEEAGIKHLEMHKQFEPYERYALNYNTGELEEKELKTMNFFSFTTTTLDIAPTDHDTREARWFDKDEVESVLTHPEDKKFFRSIIDELV